jgi:hypothetical protein
MATGAFKLARLPHDNQDDPSTREVVKVCPMCGRRFSLDDLLRDRAVAPIGISFIEGELELSAYYFTHMRPGCGTTFLVPLDTFSRLIWEQKPSDLCFGKNGCEGHCTKLGDLETCGQRCQRAPYRRFLQVLLGAPRSPLP